MIRSFMIAIVTVIAVAGAVPVSPLAAQGPLVKEFQLKLEHGSQDEFIELYVNEGKVADVKLGTAGDAAWVLDLGNLGKSKVQIYVDACKDGEVEKVIFTTGGTPTKDEDCDRKPMGAGFWNDCGVTKITLDLRRFGAKVMGCGNFFTSKTGAVTLGSIAVGGLVIGTTAGGDTNPSSTTSAPPVTTNIPVNNNPGTTTPPGTTNPNYNAAVSTSYQHDGNTSRACAVITTDPPQQGTYSGTFSGPGVLSGGTFAGSLVGGRAGVVATINVIGTYGITGSVVAQGVTRAFSGSLGVSSGAGNCVQ